MKIIKEGGHRLFETDPETADYVSQMLGDLRRRGLEAVREFSAKFDHWSPASFALSEAQIQEAIARCPAQLVQDTEFCQGNVRRFAAVQLATLPPFPPPHLHPCLRLLRSPSKAKSSSNSAAPACSVPPSSPPSVPPALPL